MAKSNRKVKDSVFSDLFGNDKDGKRNFLSLYNALHGTNLKYDETEIIHKVIPQSIYKTFNNDVSMLINGQLVVMLEHQSTINENMPFRFLEYITRIYEGMVKTEERYLEKRIKIPRPEFFVFYNGVKDYPAESILRLSDLFMKPIGESDLEPQLELTARVINIGCSKTLNIVNSCDILKQYCDFINLIRKRTIPNDETSYREAVQEAIKNDILKDYLKRNSVEAINMLIAEYDYETDIRMKCREAREEGREAGVIQVIRDLYKKGLMTAEQLSKEYNIPVEKIISDEN